MTTSHTPPQTGEQPVFDSRLAETVYYVGGALKAAGDGRVGGYLVVFGNPEQRDSYGEYFTSRCDFGLEQYKNQPVLVHHGQNDQKVCSVGIIDTLRMDAHGVYAEAQLDINHEDPAIRRYARMAYDQVVSGKLFWSSGSAGHLVRSTDDGEITQWWIVEGSLTPKPAEQSGRTQVSILRAAMKSLIEETPNPEDSADTLRLVEPTPAKEPPRDRVSSTPVRLPSRGTHTMSTAVKMGSAQILAALDNVGSLDDAAKLAVMRELAALEQGEPMPEEDPPATLADDPPVDPNLPPQDPPIAAGRSAGSDPKAIALAVFQHMRTAPAAPLPGGGGQNPSTPSPRPPVVQVRSKYADMSPEDMAFLSDRRRLLGMRSGYPYAPDPAFIREIADKTRRGLQAGTIKSLDTETANRILAIKDNELDNTQTSNQASDWVPTLWTSDLWRRVRLDNNVASSIRTIEMPAQVYELPVESTDPTVSKVPETMSESQLSLGSGNPIPDSVLASAKKTLTAVKLGLRVGFSTEMEEDSIIPWIPQLREQSMRAMLNAVDNVILNGDTTTTASTNINDIAGTPAATDKFLVFNGMRKLALVTNTAVAANAGGASPTLQMIRQARFKMISAGNKYALYPMNLVMFCDPYTYGKVLNIDELNVWMNNGRDATVNTGQVPKIDGVELYPSEELVLANTAGKIDLDTAANNTTGTIIIAARLGWTLGYRRQINTSVDFLPYYDSYQMTATVRLALINQDTVSAAVIYNIGV
jgi:hypothetical protein